MLRIQTLSGFFQQVAVNYSDAGAVRLLELVKDPSRIVFIHANLGVVEHPGIMDHIKKYIPKESEIYVVKNENKDFIDTKTIAMF